jgi:hypothetical protein
MKFSMTGQEKGDLLIQVTAWAGLNVYIFFAFELNAVFPIHVWVMEIFHFSVTT